MNYMMPFTRMVDKTGAIPNASVQMTRRLSDMRGFYADAAAEEALAKENPLVYEVFYGAEFPEVEGQLGYCTTIIYPGKVGDEYFMTKGHFHAKIDRAETYFCLSGEGHLILMTPEGETNAQAMTPGAMAFVPPYWGHRTMNTGSENFVFLAVYPADAGYNYGVIAEQGFASIIVERGGKPTVIPNPRFKGLPK